MSACMGQKDFALREEQTRSSFGAVGRKTE